MARMKPRKLSKKEQKAGIKAASISAAREPVNHREPIQKEKKQVMVPSVISVKDFADMAGLPVTHVITELMKSGILATINETIDFETASIIGDDLNLIVVKQEEASKILREKATIETKANKKDLIPRSPVVTIMGHVDHGKTSLLDKIRETHVAESESGGITQHISAYQVEIRPEDELKSREGKTNQGIPRQARDDFSKNRKITFIDTPGHAAFSAMREHGAIITDMIVLIVAAEDGVMPQTIEVIEQAKSNNVPIIVAINKVDKPDADVMKVKQQLSEYELVPEEWGGKTVMVEVSAKTGQGVDDLLEMILLQADMMDLKANPKEAAVGMVIESQMSKGTGATALVLIENGTLRRGDPVAIGHSYGRIRILEDYKGAHIDSAGPSFPVRIAGLKSVPNFGDRMLAFTCEKDAKETAEKSERIGPKMSVATAKKTGVEQEGIESGKAITLNLILKCDVKGSLEATRKLLSEINALEAVIKIISEDVGPISESDITLAKATDSIIFGFRVKELGAAKRIADKEGIKVKIFNVIYELINDVKTEISSILPPEIIEEETGRGVVLGIFRDDRKGFVAGGKVENGKIFVGDEIKFFQDNNEKYRSKILSLRKEKSEAKECVSGSECGFGLPAGANVAVGDKFVVFNTIKRKRTIE